MEEQNYNGRTWRYFPPEREGMAKNMTKRGLSARPFTVMYSKHYVTDWVSSQYSRKIYSISNFKLVILF